MPIKRPLKKQDRDTFSNDANQLKCLGTDVQTLIVIERFAILFSNRQNWQVYTEAFPNRGGSNMKRILSVCFLATIACAIAFAADQTWIGQISDSMCGASHAKMTGAHPGMSDRDCALACVKGGGQFVFVSDGKVYKIANQDSPLLQMHAGHAGVTLTGEMKGDAITVSKITMPAKK
jgi:hypothetical protein